ncbi:MAG: radical SAM (seleno)protein TrsS [Desulfitobacteriaceae bacterium]
MNINEKGIVWSSTESVCPHCLTRLPAARVMYDDKVFLEKTCPVHGKFKTLLWQGVPAWQSWVRPKIPSRPPVCYTEVEKGCPHDCGLCTEHRQHTCTALVEVTQRCNLNCSYCFASAGGQKTDPDLGAVEQWLERVYQASGGSNLQLSGGEPTVRDDLAEIIALARRRGFNFVQINSNGLRLAEDKEYVKALSEAGLNSVFLQFDGTKNEIYRRLRGRDLLAEKLQAIKNCAEQGVGVVLVPTVVPGVNDKNLGAIIHFALNNLPTVRGVHFQPVSYFGRYPKEPSDEERITLPQVMREIVEQTDGLIKLENLKPPGCENALCSFHGNFKLLPDGRVKALSNSCCGVEKAEDGARKTRKFVELQWKGVSPLQILPGATKKENSWDELLFQLKTYSFSISGMAFQDVWNLDLERLKDCCIHVASSEGKLIPFCAYNLTSADGQSLYRR